MSGNEDRIQTYISTLNINLVGNEDEIRDEWQQASRAQEGTNSSLNQSFRTSNQLIERERPRSDGTDVTSAYRDSCERPKGTFFQLCSTSQSDVTREDDKSSAYRRGKDYFEGLTNNNGRHDEQIYQKQVQFQEMENTAGELTTDGGDPLNSFSTSTKQSKMETIDQSSTKLERDSARISTTTSNNYYGETDWYMDILLRMQALDLKQKSLLVQYDFLGKQAIQLNKNDFSRSRDWARYESDYKKQAY